MYGYHYFGMHLIWWVIWVGILVYIFLTPWSIPGERRKPDTPEYLLKQRLAKGEITPEEYEKTLDLLNNGLPSDPEVKT